jgi:hypothetical protein
VATLATAAVLLLWLVVVQHNLILEVMEVFHVLLLQNKKGMKDAYVATTN